MNVSTSSRSEILEAVKRDGKALELTSASMKEDREVVLEAVNQNGNALSFASTELQGDHEIVLAAVKQNWRALEFASATLLGDREFVLEAVKRQGKALYYAIETLRKDRVVVLGAVKQNGNALVCASASFGVTAKSNRGRRAEWVGLKTPGNAEGRPQIVQPLRERTCSTVRVGLAKQRPRFCVKLYEKINCTALCLDVWKGDSEIVLQLSVITAKAAVRSATQQDNREIVPGSYKMGVHFIRIDPTKDDREVAQGCRRRM